MSEKIISKPPTPEYEETWERVFGEPSKYTVRMVYGGSIDDLLSQPLPVDYVKDRLQEPSRQ